MGVSSHEHSRPCTCCIATRSQPHEAVRAIAVVCVLVALMFNADTLIQTSLFRLSGADKEARISRSGNKVRQRAVKAAQNESEIVKMQREVHELLPRRFNKTIANPKSGQADQPMGGEIYVISGGHVVVLPWNCKVSGRRVLCKPDVLLIGASKCGTTSLANWLTYHLAFVGVGSTEKRPAIVETRLFVSSEIPMHKCWRDVTSFVKAHGRVPRVVEYTPHTLYVPVAIPNLHRLYGKDTKKLKFLVLLRDPVSRIMSSYKMKVYLGREHRTFPVVVKEGLETMDKFESRVAGYEANGTSYLRIWTKLARIREDFEQGRTYYSHHVIKSAYVYQLRAWLSIFSRSQFHILEMESVYRDPKAAFQGICEFLGEPMLATVDGELGYENEAALGDVLRTHKRDSSQYEYSPLFDTIPSTNDAYEMRVLKKRFEPLQQAMVKLIGHLDYPLP